MTRTGRWALTESRTQRLSFRKFKDYLRWLDNTSTVKNITDDQGREILIFSRQWFEEVSYESRTGRTAL